MLVVAVAAFNIVAALVMVVNEKRSDIAILRTLGLARGGVVGVFFTQGIVIGAIGTLLGVVLGVTLASRFLFKEQVGRFQWLGVALVTLGVIAVAST